MNKFKTGDRVNVTYGKAHGIESWNGPGTIVEVPYPTSERHYIVDMDDTWDYDGHKMRGGFLPEFVEALPQPIRTREEIKKQIDKLKSSPAASAKHNIAALEWVLNSEESE